VPISIKNILKGNLQKPKFKVASVWPKSTATWVIFTCPGRAGPVFRLDCGLTYFARISSALSLRARIYSLRITIYRGAYSRHLKKIAVFTYRSPHFCFPWRRPCDYHAICCMDGNKDNSVLAKLLAACTHLSSTVLQ